MKKILFCSPHMIVAGVAKTLAVFDVAVCAHMHVPFLLGKALAVVKSSTDHFYKVKNCLDNNLV